MKAHAKLQYLDPNEPKPEAVHVAFDEGETQRIFRIAEAYAGLCIAHGEPVPPDPMRALLQCAEHLQHSLSVIQAAHDKAVLDAECPGAIQ